MKFEIEVAEEDLQEMKRLMIKAEVIEQEDDHEELIRQQFFQAFGMYGDVDIRDKVKVKRVGERNEEFEKVFSDTNGFEGMGTHEIVDELKEKGWSREKITSFGIWFFKVGVEETWLLSETGFLF